MTHATSSSDRYEAARKALEYATHEEGINPTECDECGRAWPCSDARVAAALRALIEPPATVETPEQIAERIAAPFANYSAISDGETSIGGLGANSRKIARVAATIAAKRGYLAGIQAAWESWEPHDMGDGTAPPEENFWDDRTTPHAYGKTDSDRDMAARRKVTPAQYEGIIHVIDRVKSDDSPLDSDEYAAMIGAALGMTA